MKQIPFILASVRVIHKNSCPYDDMVLINDFSNLNKSYWGCTQNVMVHWPSNL